MRSRREPRAARRHGHRRRRQLQRVRQARRRGRAAALRRRRRRRTPSQVIPLDAARHRTYHYWHVFVPGLAPGQIYALPRARPVRARARAAVRRATRCCSIRTAAPSPCPTATTATPPAGPATTPRRAMKSVVADPGRYDWEGDAPLQPAVRRNRHLRDARRRLHPPSELRRRAGEARHLRRPDREDSLPQDLGVTAVELLPVFQFDPHARAERR